MRPAPLALAAAVALSACSPPESTPVGVTLQDGQVLVGAITTETLHLESSLGPLAIPLDDVGVVLPADGTQISESDGEVTVWLRNGSELRGRWTEPELAVGLEVGGTTVEVELPVGDVQAFQTRGAEIWPKSEVFRIRTAAGDDFLVDLERSRIPIENELGEFAPFLSECRSAAPIHDPLGDWRVELLNGTILVGPLQAKALTFAMQMGPGQVSVPLAQLASLERDRWDLSSSDVYEPMAAEAGPAPRKARPALSSSDGWFDYRGLDSAKRH